MFVMILKILKPIIDEEVNIRKPIIDQDINIRKPIVDEEANKLNILKKQTIKDINSDPGNLP